MKTNLLAIAVLVALPVAFAAGPLSAQSPPRPSPPSSDEVLQSLRRDMAELIKGQLELQKQIQELKAALQASQAAPPAPPRNIVFDVSGAAAQGGAKAPVTMIEFSDFACPFSAKFNHETRPQIEQNYIATGKVRYVFRDFPLPSLHPFAPRIAEAGQCALAQNQFWPMHALFFAGQSSLLNDDILLQQARQAKLDAKSFEACLRESRFAGTVTQEISQASADGVTGTPTFFLGRTDPAGKIKVSRVIVGSQTYAAFQQAIDALLAEPGAAK